MFAIAKLQQPLILLRISRKCTTPSARRLLKVTLVLMDFEHLLKGSKSKEGSEVLSTGMEKKKKKREQFFTGFLVLFVKHWCLTVAETWPRELPFCAHSLCQQHHKQGQRVRQKCHIHHEPTPFSAPHWLRAKQHGFALRSSKLDMNMNRTTRWSLKDGNICTVLCFMASRYFQFCPL